MAKLAKNVKVISYLMVSFVFLAIGVLGSPSIAWCDCTSCGNCPPPVIGFTSKQMSVNGNQTLTAIGGMGPYTWTKASGGGSLSGSSGTSVTYTAPGSNDNCTNNPTIQVTDYCGNTTTLKIAINAYNQQVDAYYIVQASKDITNCGFSLRNNFFSCDGTPGQQNWGGCGGSCVKTCNGYCCLNDSLTSCYFNPGCNGECPGCNVNSPDPWCCQGAKNDCTSDSYIQYMATSGGCANSCGRAWLTCPHNCYPYDTPIDMRGPSCQNILQYGCCPVIVSTCLNITSFSTDVQAINLAAGQTANLTGNLQANGGGTASWTITVAGQVFSGSGNSISQSWDGRDSSGKRVDPGTYSVNLVATTTGGSCGSDSDSKTVQIIVKSTYEQESAPQSDSCPVPGSPNI